MQIFAVRVPNRISVDLISILKSNLNKRNVKYKLTKDLVRTLIGELVVRVEFLKRYNNRNEEIIFITNKYGKPYIEQQIDFKFNVSHSNEWVVVSIDNEENGIDIEEISPISFHVAKHFFSQQEYIDLMSINEEIRIQYFYDLWTLKESYIKAVGEGLHIDLDSFTIRKIGTFISISKRESRGEPYFFKQYNIDEKYKLSVCSKQSTFPDNVIFYDFNYLLEVFLTFITID
ncbi:4'-phosphopantetheinyl transferase superfamily protein [Cytobacillus sp. FSL K6-0129]|uniref:4'-phosphopantetheinyl transferase family protein n=1 Tax=Cytobacillus sp. FSL K6-0129 TaxID=2921421 RepID=UPI0030FCD7D5